MWTNREFYDFVEALPDTKRSLETDLRALAALLAPDTPNDAERLLWQQISELPRLNGEGDCAVVRGSDSRWYNTSILSFLSAGASGAWNGFQAAGESLEYMPFLHWHEIQAFLRNGQWYE